MVHLQKLLHITLHSTLLCIPHYIAPHYIAFHTTLQQEKLVYVELGNVALVDAINATLLMSPRLPRGKQQCCKIQNKLENEDELKRAAEKSYLWSR